VSQALIAALSWPHQVIGHRGRLPWHITLELQLFREVTWGDIVVMGRRTYESLPRTFLPGRELWVLSRSLKTGSAPGVSVLPSWQALLEKSAQVEKPLFFAGGADIFRQALELPSVQTLYLSWVMTAVEGDTYFPPISEEWQPISWKVFNKMSGLPIPFIFFVYHR